jgi:hypothetical protein
MPTDTTTVRQPGTAGRTRTRRLLDDLQAAHAEGRKLADELVAAVADCDDHLAEVATVLEAVVRHADPPVAIVDADLGVHAASPAAAELLETRSVSTGSGRRSLQPVLPPGGAAEVRRCLVPELGGDIPAPDDEADAVDPRPRVIRLQADALDVTVERVCARRRPLGGLWGGWLPPTRGRATPTTLSPRFPYGLVTFRAVDAGRDTPVPAGGTGPD